MSRSFNTIPEETNRPADYAKPAAPVMSVCPFCGAISEKNEAACPRCKMENSALTRQATRARIGPWYVMQSRNPSAPGMKCNTLLALIRKGQVTPRSVIRGPTTFQLWRFAARVKGISKEFGLCYSCGGEVQRTSTFCARCSRSQELPPNPDVLLENEPQAKTVYRQVNNPRPETPETAPAQPAAPSRPGPPAEPERRSSPQIPTAAETMAELADIPSPHNAPMELQTRPRQKPQEGVLTPRELAAAFSLQYDPTMDGATKIIRRNSGGGKSFLAAALLLLCIGGVASIFYFSPSLRQRIVAFVQDSTPPASAAPENSTAPKSFTDHTPDWMMTVPNDKPVSSPVKSVSTPTTPAADTVTSSFTSQNNSTPPAHQNSPALQNNSSPSPAIVHVPAPKLPPPPLPKDTDVATNTNTNTNQTNTNSNNTNSNPLPTPAFDNPVTTSTPVDPRTSVAMATASKLRQSSGDDLDGLAMKLRFNGLDAEHRQDYAAAKYYYQQVETLPHDNWPGDIDQLLKSAEKHAQP